MGPSESQLRFSNEGFSRSKSRGKILVASLSLTDSLIILKHWAGTTSKTAHFAQCGRVGVDVFGARQSMAADWVTLVLCCPLTSSESSLGGDAHQMCSFKDKPIWIYDNIWQTSSTEWQGWPTASESNCLSRKQVLWCSSHDRPHPVPPNSIHCVSVLGASPGPQTLPCFWSGLVGFRRAVSPFTTIFKNKSWMKNPNVSLRSSGHMFHHKSANIYWSSTWRILYHT